MTIKNYVYLLRMQQWYKNLVVFLALFFSGNMFRTELLHSSVLAFFSLALASSAGYIFNDIMDLHQDKVHPEKKFRPLAAGKISKSIAVLLALVLFSLGTIIAILLSRDFFLILLGLFALSVAYTLFFKNIVLIDVLTIATLFVLRAISGAVVIGVFISPWLILVPFFLSLFLTVGKRHADLQLLKENAHLSRSVLNDYNHNLTNSLMSITTTLIIMSYALYSFLSGHQLLIYSLPLALYVIFRYYYLINTGSIISRQPEKVIKDRPMIIGILLWTIITALIIYL